MKNFDKKIPVIILLILIAIVAIYFFIKEDSYQPITNEDLYVTQNIVSNSPETEKIIIHIVGEVNNPGIVSLPSGSRISDAIEAAGGLTSLADISKVNLAYVLRRWAKNLYSKY